MEKQRIFIFYRYDGSPVCNILYPCRKCQLEDENLKCRQRSEKNTFLQVCFFILDYLYQIQIEIQHLNEDFHVELKIFVFDKVQNRMLNQLLEKSIR